MEVSRASGTSTPSHQTHSNLLVLGAFRKALVKWYSRWSQKSELKDFPIVLSKSIMDYK
ncbi:MAG TPA: hypothetical protein VK671_04920 [Mucilaginibacter sp.]|nr:hypothetical protein [Mucilaginibacter sp.]